ncbi:MAG: hypothetical protein PHO15_10430 [Eubacteriales bacterium]|nr:hypothetical protein [Eubacteriales bacterium]
MKNYCVVLLILALFILTSCTDASVSYSLKDNNSIKIVYSITTSAADEKISDYADDTAAYWEEMGFSTDTSEDDDQYTISGQKTIRKNSMNQASSKFSSILTDDESLFDNVTFEYTPSYFEDNFSLTASVSLKDLFYEKTNQDIPVAELENLLDSAKDGLYTLSIELPGDVVETNADTQRDQVCTWLIRYGETTQIALKTKNVFDENIANYAGLTETQNNDNLLFIIGCIVTGTLLAAVIIIVFIRKARNQKSA